MTMRREKAKPRATQPCVVCGEPIAVGAKKCTHCSSYQNRFVNGLTTWSAILAAPLALVPLFGIAGALLALMPAASKGKIEMQLLSCARDKVQAAYINSGKSPAMVVGFTFDIVKSGKSESVTTQTRQDMAANQAIAPNDKPVTVSYVRYSDSSSGFFIPAGSTTKGCLFRLTAIWKDFSGTNGKIKRECPCPD